MRTKLRGMEVSARWAGAERCDFPIGLTLNLGRLPASDLSLLIHSMKFTALCVLTSVMEHCLPRSSCDDLQEAFKVRLVTIPSVTMKEKYLFHLKKVLEG